MTVESREGRSVNWNKAIRQTHRVLSIAFTLAVIANLVAMARGEPPVWVTFSALPPLLVLLFTGLYLFVLPYVAKSRGGQGTDASRTADPR